MSVLLVLKIIISLATAATGGLAFIKPEAVYGFTGLSATSVRGISEIRAIFGGLFIALGVAPIVLSQYRLLGIAYLAIALARVISIIVDKSYAQSNLISLAIEIVFGVILVI
jgi:Domain of unknown function (DUF4345)